MSAAPPARAIGAPPPPRVGLTEPAWVRGLLIAIVVAFLGCFLLLPLAVVFHSAFAKGWTVYRQALGDPIALSAVRLTLLATGTAVVFNTLFGVAAAWLITRFRFPGKSLLISLIDLPFAVSPVISGLIFVLVFGAHGWAEGRPLAWLWPMAWEALVGAAAAIAAAVLWRAITARSGSGWWLGPALVLAGLGLAVALAPLLEELSTAAGLAALAAALALAVWTARRPHGASRRPGLGWWLAPALLAGGAIAIDHWLWPWLLAENDRPVIFAWPGITLATMFVTFPFVARELIPVMQSVGQEEEQAALSLGASGWTTFWRVTMPNVKWGLLYGVVLCNARAMGEFGAVSVVSGHIRGQTNTMPLHIEILFNEYHFAAAFAVASILALLALVTLVAKTLLEYRLHQSGPEP